ncbi:hypothetical protein J9303_00465 [Bacillaceae bacterium Marseille-Q3522]|nr:hypothetical protein [Bacillaceae bacterium Marseille-Q3522]
MAKILAPNKQYSGVSASVKFEKGAGETNDKALIEWFKAHGYEVEEEKKTSKSKQTSKATKSVEKGEEDGSTEAETS